MFWEHGMYRNSQHRKAKGEEWVSASKGSEIDWDTPKEVELLPLFIQYLLGTY